MLTPTSLVHLPQLIAIARQDLTTDLSPLEVGALLGLMKGNHLKISRLEGTPVMYKEQSFWLPAGKELPGAI